MQRWAASDSGIWLVGKQESVAIFEPPAPGRDSSLRYLHFRHVADVSARRAQLARSEAVYERAVQGPRKSDRPRKKLAGPESLLPLPKKDGMGFPARQDDIQEGVSIEFGGGGSSSYAKRASSPTRTLSRE